MVCANRGEEHLDASTTEQVLRMAEEAAAAAQRPPRPAPMSPSAVLHHPRGRPCDAPS